MPTLISVRIPDDLLKQIDADAEAGCVTRTAEIVNSLWASRRTATVAPTTTKQRRLNTALSLSQSAIKEQQRPIGTALDAQSAPVPVTANYTPRPTHDPATCRVYKCLICSLK